MAKKNEKGFHEWLRMLLGSSTYHSAEKHQKNAAWAKVYGASAFQAQRNQVLIYHNTPSSDHTLSFALSIPAEVPHDTEKI